MSDDFYILGSSPGETKRLELQGTRLEPITRHLLQDLGLEEGMSVLDIGTGTGDVALLAAPVVGPSGRVVGVDRDADILAHARRRAQAAGLDRVAFETCPIKDAGRLGRFDLVVGRYILHHQPDQVPFLRHLTSLVRPGGILALVEPVLVPETRFSEPPVAVYDATVGWLIKAYGAMGIDLDVGRRLVKLFSDAGLPEPALICETPFGGAASTQIDWMCLSLGSLLPTLERAGLATAADVGIDTLEDRIRRAASASRSQLCGPTNVGAWARVN